MDKVHTDVNILDKCGVLLVFHFTERCEGHLYSS